MSSNLTGPTIILALHEEIQRRLHPQRPRLDEDGEVITVQMAGPAQNRCLSLYLDGDEIVIEREVWGNRNLDHVADEVKRWPLVDPATTPEVIIAAFVRLVHRSRSIVNGRYEYEDE